MTAIVNENIQDILLMSEDPLHKLCDLSFLDGFP